MKKTFLALVFAAILPGAAQADSFQDVATQDFTLTSAGSMSFLLSWVDLFSTRVKTGAIEESDGKFSLKLLGNNNQVVVKLNDFIDSSQSKSGTYSYNTGSLSAGSYSLVFEGKWNGKINDNRVDSIPSVSNPATQGPESYGMFLAGLGIIGAIAKRRKTA